MYKQLFFRVSFAILLLVIGFSFFWPSLLWCLLLVIPPILLGGYDAWQPHSNVLRNYPLIGHLRYGLLAIRPQIQQYFIETNYDGRPFSHEVRHLVYHLSTQRNATLAFGTLLDVYEPGYESICHSLQPTEPDPMAGRVLVGNAQCSQPYLASRLNVSAMSFGALSPNAIQALNLGAKLGGFAHNTGEGGLSDYHLMGGDLIWQIGTGYFGCRTSEGLFDAALFAEKAKQPTVKMIELKLSQGAKPAHGGILPGIKVTPEISRIRGVPMGRDAISPPAHPRVATPLDLLAFIQELRELSGGKPVGFKLCVGLKHEFLAICKAMCQTGIYPDFITVDGSEGGTGAAPLEFANSVGLPLEEALPFVHNALVGCDLRQHIRLICSGKIATGFDMVNKMAMGADMCNSARAMLFALGCIQSLRCNTNQCPTGVATQDPKRYQAVHVPTKAERVRHYHDATLKNFLSVLGAAGVTSPETLNPYYLHRCIAPGQNKNYIDIYHYLRPGQLLAGDCPASLRYPWACADPESFIAREVAHQN